MVDEKRLVDEFVKLAAIESPSRHEREVADYLKGVLKELGADVSEDGAAKETGGNSGNILGRIGGNRHDAPTMLLNAHMDTVAPGRGIRPVIREGVIYSEGETILGSDDKSGIAIILEVIRTVRENNLPHGKLEILFTVCEEVGLLGAKSFDTSVLEAKFGYSLDSTKSGSLVYAAPAANHLKFTIYGRESHAGLSPEKGVSAIQLAGKALSKMPLGRIDGETTANIGLIRGGSATNIVPGMVEMEGEARSHDTEKLKRQTEEMVRCVREVVEKAAAAAAGIDPAKWDVDIRLDYPLMRLREECRTITLAGNAAADTNMELQLLVGGGGSDVNILNAKGIEMAVMGTGMDNVHTNDELIKIDDMVKAAELLLEAVTRNCSYKL